VSEWVDGSMGGLDPGWRMMDGWADGQTLYLSELATVQLKKKRIWED